MQKRVVRLRLSGEPQRDSSWHGQSPTRVRHVAKEGGTVTQKPTRKAASQLGSDPTVAGAISTLWDKLPKDAAGVVNADIHAWFMNQWYKALAPRIKKADRQRRCEVAWQASHQGQGYLDLDGFRRCLAGLMDLWVHSPHTEAYVAFVARCTEVLFAPGVPEYEPPDIREAREMQELFEAELDVIDITRPWKWRSRWDKVESFEHPPPAAPGPLSLADLQQDAASEFASTILSPRASSPRMRPPLGDSMLSARAPAKRVTGTALRLLQALEAADTRLAIPIPTVGGPKVTLNTVEISIRLMTSDVPDVDQQSFLLSCGKVSYPTTVKTTEGSPSVHWDEGFLAHLLLRDLRATDLVVELTHPRSHDVLRRGQLAFQHIVSETPDLSGAVECTVPLFDRRTGRLKGSVVLSVCLPFSEVSAALAGHTVVAHAPTTPSHLPSSRTIRLNQPLELSAVLSADGPGSPEDSLLLASSLAETDWLEYSESLLSGPRSPTSVNRPLSPTFATRPLPLLPLSPRSPMSPRSPLSPVRGVEEPGSPMGSAGSPRGWWAEAGSPRRSPTGGHPSRPEPPSASSAPPAASGGAKAGHGKVPRKTRPRSPAPAKEVFHLLRATAKCAVASAPPQRPVTQPKGRHVPQRAGTEADRAPDLALAGPAAPAQLRQRRLLRRAPAPAPVVVPASGAISPLRDGTADEPGSGALSPTSGSTVGSLVRPESTPSYRRWVAARTPDARPDFVVGSAAAAAPSPRTAAREGKRARVVLPPRTVPAPEALPMALVVSAIPVPQTPTKPSPAVAPSPQVDSQPPSPTMSRQGTVAAGVSDAADGPRQLLLGQDVALPRPRGRLVRGRRTSAPPTRPAEQAPLPRTATTPEPLCKAVSPPGPATPASLPRPGSGRWAAPLPIDATLLPWGEYGWLQPPIVVPAPAPALPTDISQLSVSS
eukprot:EG_transcript_1238